jgi:putative addiction module killer protein
MIEIRETDTYHEWFEALKDKRAKARIDVRIRRVSIGNFGDVKPVGKGIFELRIDYGPGYRVYFTQHRNILVILLCGGDKSTQAKDIERAHELAQALAPSETDRVFKED